MSIHLKVYTIMICFTILNCGIAKSTPFERNGKSITFGKGGGISGIEYSKVLLDNGKLFELENRGTSYSFLKKLGREEVDQIFLTVNMLQLENIKLNSPGNTYKFIEFKNSTSENRIVWTADNASHELQVLYRILNNKAQ